MKTTNTTKIEWTNHTINFWWGCTKVSPACTHCYAEEMGKRFGPRLFGQPVLWGAGKPRFERLEAARRDALKLDNKALMLGERPRVFVNSMSDWLDAEVPIEWLAALLETIRICPNLDFQLLTKRPENFQARLFEVETLAISTLTPLLAKWMTGFAPANIWIGTTVENQRYADERIPHLLQIPAKVRFLSMEPLSGAVDLETIGLPEKCDCCGEPTFFNLFTGNVTCKGSCDGPQFINRIHWLIAGGESGGQAVPSHPDWFRSLRDQCRTAGVPFFFKQWGEWLPQNHVKEAIELAQRAALEEDRPLIIPRAFKSHHFHGSAGPHEDGLSGKGTQMLRLGTKLAGHLLDGEEWRQFPTQ